VPPSGLDWLHEIEHDGFRILARKDGDQVKLITRSGYDFADRYPLILDAITRLPVETCIIDGQAIVVDQNGLSIFDRLRYRKHDHAAARVRRAATTGPLMACPKLERCVDNLTFSLYGAGTE
jgi:ATP-dependent DNA ligase